jgi:O-antigen/teichoic acid export membrane protein
VPVARKAGAAAASRGGRILRDFLFQSGSRYLGAVLGILRGLVIPRFLDPALYGVFKTYATFSELSRIGTLGIPSALFPGVCPSRQKWNAAWYAITISSLDMRASFGQFCSIASRRLRPHLLW